MFETIVILAIGGLGYLLKEEMEKRKEAERKVYEKRYSMYMELISALFTFMNSGMDREHSKNEIKNFHVALKTAQIEMLLLASDDVYIAFKEMLKNSYGASNNTAITMYLLYDLVIKIRKDLGYSSTKLLPLDALEASINDLGSSESGKEIVQHILEFQKNGIS